MKKLITLLAFSAVMAASCKKTTSNISPVLAATSCLFTSMTGINRPDNSISVIKATYDNDGRLIKWLDETTDSNRTITDSVLTTATYNAKSISLNTISYVSVGGGHAGYETSLIKMDDNGNAIIRYDIDSSPLQYSNAYDTMVYIYDVNQYLICKVQNTFDTTVYQYWNGNLISDSSWVLNPVTLATEPVGSSTYQYYTDKANDFSPITISAFFYKEGIKNKNMLKQYTFTTYETLAPIPIATTIASYTYTQFNTLSYPTESIVSNTGSVSNGDTVQIGYQCQ